MRVLHVHSGNLFGGVESFLLALVRPDAPFESHFALAFDGRLSQTLVAQGARVDMLPPVRLRRPLSVLRSRKALKLLLERAPADVVLVHSGWTQLIYGPVVRASGQPLVRFMHAPPPRHWMERAAARSRPALLLCNSAFTAEGTRGAYGEVPWRVVHPPTDMLSERADSEGRRAVRQRLGLRDTDVVVLQVSRIEPLKGHTLHLQALARLRGVEGWRALFVGGAQRPVERTHLGKLQRLTAELGLSERVRWMGERTDVASLLNAADVYCQPNTAPEAYGLTFVEALSAGLPVVTTAMGGALEIVDEHCGRLVPPQPAAVAAALSELLGDSGLRERLGQAGRRRAEGLGQREARLLEMRKALEECTALWSAGAPT